MGGKSDSKDLLVRLIVFLFLCNEVFVGNSDVLSTVIGPKCPKCMMSLDTSLISMKSTLRIDDPIPFMSRKQLAAY